MRNGYTKFGVILQCRTSAFHPCVIEVRVRPAKDPVHAPGIGIAIIVQIQESSTNI